MTYMEQIINTVNATKIGVPIYTADLAEQIMAEFALEQNKAESRRERRYEADYGQRIMP